PAAVQPDDRRRSTERAEHQRDPAVVAQVRDGLRAAAGVVQVRHSPRPEHGEGTGHPLWRDVHMSVYTRGCGGHEEHMLLEQEVPEPALDRLIKFSHAPIVAGQETGPARFPGIWAPRLS